MSRSALIGWVLLAVGVSLVIGGVARGFMGVGEGCGLPFLPFTPTGNAAVIESLVASCSAARSDAIAVSWGAIAFGMFVALAGSWFLLKASGVRRESSSAR